MLQILGFVLLALLIPLNHVSSAQAQTSASPTQDGAARCTALRGAKLYTDDETPIGIYDTKVTKIFDDLPETCVVEGFAAPTVGFRIALPIQDWNGKYVQSGCGGACGTTQLFWCDEALKRHYACLNTDMGHKSSTADWSWAADNLQGRVDFAFRSTHLAAIAGKAVAKAFFDSAPKLSYFFGCSSGGRQALIEAQRFPHDFQGIIGGAPPVNQTGVAIELGWNVLANLRADGTEILAPKDARVLHEAVVDACDMNDGVKDGLIGDPRLCKFNIQSLKCTKSEGKSCLAADQIIAASKIYSGPLDSKGRPIGRQGGAMLGSELYWIGDYISDVGRPAQYAKFIANAIKNANFTPVPKNGWQLKDLDFDRDQRRFDEAEALYNAGNPDLRDFQATGGKFLAFQGWADTSVVPMAYIDYYETLTRTMGGPEKTTEFFRLFTIPGMRHCSADGLGAEAINYLEALENWVERGQAPNVLIGASVDWGGPIRRSPTYPIDPAKVRFTRPAYLYPAVPIYKGTGDPNEAANFRPSTTP